MIRSTGHYRHRWITQGYLTLDQKEEVTPSTALWLWSKISQLNCVFSVHLFVGEEKRQIVIKMKMGLKVCYMCVCEMSCSEPNRRSGISPIQAFWLAQSRHFDQHESCQNGSLLKYSNRLWNADQHVHLVVSIPATFCRCTRHPKMLLLVVFYEEKLSHRNSAPHECILKHDSIQDYRKPRRG